MNSADEIRHLQTGPAPGEKPGGAGLVSFTAACSDNAQAVVARAKEVLEIVLRQDPGHWPSDKAWEGVLPRWFVAQCAPERSREEIDRLIALGQQLSYEEQVHAERTARWSVSEWIYWLQPEMREWYWWDASVPNRETVIIVVEADDLPFAWGSLDWLLRASGAVTVNEDLP